MANKTSSLMTCLPWQMRPFNRVIYKVTVGQIEAGDGDLVLISDGYLPSELVNQDCIYNQR